MFGEHQRVILANVLVVRCSNLVSTNNTHPPCQACSKSFRLTRFKAFSCKAVKEAQNSQLRQSFIQHATTGALTYSCPPWLQNGMFLPKLFLSPNDHLLVRIWLDCAKTLPYLSLTLPHESHCLVFLPIRSLGGQFKAQILTKPLSTLIAHRQSHDLFGHRRRHRPAHWSASKHCSRGSSPFPRPGRSSPSAHHSPDHQSR